MPRDHAKKVRGPRQTGALAAFAACVCLLAMSAPSYGDPVPAARKASAPPLAGTTYDFPSGDALGRVYVHPRAGDDAGRPRPILVFLHGLNTELIKYRWMGGGNEGDVRRIAGELMDAGATTPFLVAAPSAIAPSAVSVARTMWSGFDLDAFLDRTEERLRGVATIDRSRVIVAGHSGGACNDKGGVAAAGRAKTAVYAALSIDGCMDPPIATELLRVRPATHVVVAWQMLSWQKRPIRAFRRRFAEALATSPAAEGALRELEELRPKAPMPHDAMVGLTLGRWLPRLLPADACGAPAPADRASAPAALPAAGE